MELPNRPVDPEALADERLLPRLRAGDDDAFSDLVHGYGERLMALARRLLKSEWKACDAVGDAFAKVIEHLPGFAGRSSLYTWMYRITLNAALMRLRRERRDQRWGDHDVDPSEGVPMLATAPPRDPLVDAEESELLGVVLGHIESLGDDQRGVLVLRDIEGFSTREVADMLGIEEGTVRVRLHRARRRLRSLLGELAEDVS